MHRTLVTSVLSPRLSRIGRGIRAAIANGVLTGLILTASGGTAFSDVAVSTGFERRVDVGGYSLFVRCTGQGSPTVILDAALGNSSATWSGIQPAVAGFTRVCSYDRAGLGRSDRAPLPTTSQSMVDDLRNLLRNADIPGPYVLVGHSFGGFNVQLFARQDGGVAVTGVVFVDATPAQWVAVADRLGLPLPTLNQNPEGADLRASAHQVLSAPGFPNVPLVVLTRGVSAPDPALESAWQELQAAHAELSSQGHLVVAEGARHFIHLDRPDLVIESIQWVVEQARAQTRPGKGCGDQNHFHELKAECEKPVRID